MGPEQYHGHLEINGAYVLSQNVCVDEYVPSLSTVTNQYRLSRRPKVRRRSGDDVS